MKTVKQIERQNEKKQNAIAKNIPAEIIKNAQIEGVKAFESGKKMTNAFSEYAAKSEHDTIALLNAYWHGYTIAKLARAADESFPSAIELKKLMAA